MLLFNRLERASMLVLHGIQLRSNKLNKQYKNINIKNA